MKYYSTEPGQYPEENKNTGNEFFGNGWSVKEESNKFVLTYISGSLQGTLKSVDISKVDFISAKEGKVNLDGL
jgi:hypothetical protein